MDISLPEWLDPSPWLETACGDDPGAAARALAAPNPGEAELAVLISPGGAGLIEPLARRAAELTRTRFGRTVSLYAPLYLSDYCSSGCLYCGFASDREIHRRKLEGEELRRELEELRRRGFAEVLLLTGERTPEADYPYLHSCVELAAGIFPRVTVEAFPMTGEEYRGLASAGCDGVTVYQETYDPLRYEQLHRWGPKRDYAGRLDTPARALAAGIRSAGIGVLLGLSDPVFDALCLYRHGRRLARTYWRSEISVSFPRVRPQAGGFSPPFPVDETFLARLILAFRICLPDFPLVLSTRESPRFRDGMAGLGINKMSAASRTTVGGYSRAAAGEPGQFAVSDTRDVEIFRATLKSRNLEPVFKDWDAVYR